MRVRLPLQPHPSTSLLVVVACVAHAQLPSSAHAQTAARLIESHGFRIERQESLVDGVRVIGAELVVRRAPDGHIDWTHIDWTHSAAPSSEALRQALHGVDWTRTEQAAREAARDAPHAQHTEIEGVGERTLFRHEGTWRPAWRFTRHSLGSADDVFVLLPSLTVARIEPRSRDALGDVFARNPVSDEGRSTRITLPPQRAFDVLANANFDVRSCDVQTDGRCVDARRAVPDARGDFLLTPEATSFDDGFAEVNAFHHLSEIADRFARDHAFRYACPIGAPIDVHVNYTLAPHVPHANAAFIPGSSERCASFVFGQAATFDFAYDADVLHHEFAHLVTQETAGLRVFSVDAQGAHFEPLALSEGTSDYWAAVMQGDGVIGESVREIGLLDRAQTIREIDPVYTCPASLEGAGHLDGRLWSSAMWALRRELGEKIDTLMYVTVASLSNEAGFSEAAELAITSAQSLVGREGFTMSDATRVETLMRERGLVDCRRIIPMHVGQVHAFYAGLPGSTGAFGAGLAPMQIALATPRDVRRITFRWRALSPRGRYVLHLRRGQPIELDGRTIVSDEHAELIGESISFTRFGACEDVYFAIQTLDISEGPSFLELTLSSMEGGASCDVDAGDVDAGRAPPSMARGGGCSAQRSRASAPMFTLLALLTLLIRRHRAAAFDRARVLCRIGALPTPGRRSRSGTQTTLRLIRKTARQT